jgi:hypothetical protein
VAAPASTFVEAADFARLRKLFPTSLSSEQLSELPVEVRRRSVFSARVEEANVLDVLRTGISRIVAGDYTIPGDYENTATLQDKLLLELQRIEYKAPPGKEGTIQDLSSDQRLNLIVRTQETMAAGYARFQQQQAPGVIDAFPALELVRAQSREVPRGYEKRGTQVVAVDPEYWKHRWIKAGGEVYGDRMIAAKDDPVWEKLSAFGEPWPPFDFNSGMGVTQIGRREAERLGVISPGERIAPQLDRKFNDSLQASTEGLSGPIVDALTAQGYTDKGGTLTP